MSYIELTHEKRELEAELAMCHDATQTMAVLNRMVKVEERLIELKERY